MLNIIKNKYILLLIILMTKGIDKLNAKSNSTILKNTRKFKDNLTNHNELTPNDPIPDVDYSKKTGSSGPRRNSRKSKRMIDNVGWGLVPTAYDTLAEWSAEVVRAAALSEPGGCLDSTGAVYPVNPNPCLGQDGANYTKCITEADMFDDMSNPILANLINAGDITAGERENPVGTAIQQGLAQAALGAARLGVGWLTIPTQVTNNVNAAWGPIAGAAGHNANESTTSYDVKNSTDTVSMLIVRKFTTAQSKEIYATILGGTGANHGKGDSMGTLSDGRDIIFTDEGHIKIRLPSVAGYEGAARQTREYLNQYIHMDENAPGVSKQFQSGVAVSSTAGQQVYTDKSGINKEAGSAGPALASAPGPNTDGSTLVPGPNPDYAGGGAVTVEGVTYPQRGGEAGGRLLQEDINFGFGGSQNKEMSSNHELGTFSAFASSKSSTYSENQGYPSGSLIYAMGPKVVMNKALTYILYTPVDESAMETSGGEAFTGGSSVYYLLYNPIHTVAFKRFYQSQLQQGYASTAALSLDKLYTQANTGSGFPADPYSAPTRRVSELSGCLQKKTIPPYQEIIGKYCNAFKLSGLRNRANNTNMLHYADPFCPYAMNEKQSQIGLATNNNIAAESIRETYYMTQLTSTKFDGYVGYGNAMSALDSDRNYLAQLWACTNHPRHIATTVDTNIGDYMTALGWHNGEQSGEAALNKKYPARSFITDLANARIAKNTNDSVSIWVSQQSELKDISRGSNAGLPACRLAAKSISTCTNIVNTQGSVEESTIVQQSICAAQGGPVTCSSPPCGAGGDPEQKKPCELVLTVPACAPCVLDNSCTPGEDAKPGMTMWTACCQAKGSFTEALCPEPVAGESCADTLIANSFKSTDEYAATAGTSIKKGEYLGQLGNLSTRVTKASDVALTAEKLYPDDVAIIKLAKEIMLDAGTITGTITSLTTRANLIVESTGDTEMEAIPDAIAPVLTDVRELEIEALELVALIADIYFYGQKKIYIYGAIAALVVIILLIVLLS